MLVSGIVESRHQEASSVGVHVPEAAEAEDHEPAAEEAADHVPAAAPAFVHGFETAAML
jgi:hypothetical protein